MDCYIIRVKETTFVGVLLLVSSMFGAPLVAAENAYACANPPATDGYNCILFDIDCGDKRILIKDASYVFENHRNGTCISENEKCRTAADGCCRSTSGSYTKSFAIDHKYKIYESCSWRNSCIKRTPTVDGENGSDASVLEYECRSDKYTVHLCAPTTESIKEGKVNIIFNGTEYSGYYPRQCVCTVKMTKMSESYEISAPDLRLWSTSLSCNPNTTLSGLKDIEVTCDPSVTVTNMDKVQRNDERERNITLSFQSEPEFIWIILEAKGGGGNKMSVECFAEVQLPTTASNLPTTQSMEISSVANTTASIVTDSTSSSLISPVANTTIDTGTSLSSHQHNNTYSSSSVSTSASVTTHVTTATTVAESNGPDTMANHEISSDEFPIVAVIIPVVVLVCVGVGIMAWLKLRQRRQSGSKTHDKGRDKTSQNRPTNAIQNKAYDKTDLPGNGPMKTTDNYIDLDQENTYTYIDHENAKVGLGKSNGTNLSSSNISDGFSFGRDNRKEDTDYAHTYVTKNAVHNYADIESQSFNKGANIHDTSKIEYKSGNVQNHDYIVLEPGNAVADESDNKSNETNNNGALEGNTYFILEPQTELSSNKVSSTVNGNLRTHKTAENEAQSNTYFVLEPQNPQTKPTTPQKTTTGTVGLPGVGKVNNQNYEFAVETPGNNQNYAFALEPPENNQNYEFALEPQDTYSSIDPDDVATQTLPENEYNVINMTGKATISRDPNYGTLDAVAKKGKEIEDSGEYSHIGQDANKNKEMNDYMKGTLGTADKKGGGIEDSGDYAHIGKD